MVDGPTARPSSCPKVKAGAGDVGEKRHPAPPDTRVMRAVVTMTAAHTAAMHRAKAAHESDKGRTSGGIP